MKKWILLLIPIFVFAGIAGAIPNPSAVYCKLQGYEYEIRTDEQGGQYGVCIFPDGSECSTWHYYCKCEPDGIGCWPGDFSCHWPCEEIPCKDAGEAVFISKCCEGLDEIYPAHIFDDNCNTLEIIGWLFLCSDCGNGICEDWESRCNCPADCAQPRIIFVDDDGPADFNNIQAAIDDSNNGDTIIVADGTYFENINFKGKNITLTSTEPENANVVAAIVIDGGRCGSVVTFNNGEDANCILNGFTITNGYADDGIFPTRLRQADSNCITYHGGGGIYCEHSSPTLTNCVVTGNSAKGDGGAMCNDFGSPILINCMFIKNSATLHGAGMYNLGGSPTLTNCTFSENSTPNGGGGIYNRSGNLTLTNCTFSRNSAGWNGGGMRDGGNSTLTNCIFSGNSAEDSGGGMCNGGNPTLTNCTFTDNLALWRGAGMCTGGNPTLTSCNFSGNKAGHEGGGMWNFRSNPTLTNCTFSGNSASNGGGMFNWYDTSLTVTNCTFSGNSAQSRSGKGGGMYVSRDSSILIHCLFTENSADTGGGMYNLDSNPTVSNCKFNSNSAEDFGGGIYNYESSPILLSCTFSGNYSDEYGGGIFNSISDLIVANCTLTGNRAAKQGGGFFITPPPSSPTSLVLPVLTSHAEVGDNIVLTNCILWANESPDGSQILLIPDSVASVNYSDIQGGWPGEGNIDADPCFVQPGYWDVNGTPSDPNDDFWIEGNYHLLPGSPCIDAGDPNYAAETNETDLDGRPRVIGGRIDMGAYEYSPPIPADVYIEPDTLNLTSKGKWITAFIQMPEDYDMNDIDPNSVYLEGDIEPERFWIAEDNQVAIAKFSREEVQAILIVGEVELTITGQLSDGTFFEGTDVIRVINEGERKN